MAGRRGWRPRQTLRMGGGRARWPAGLEHPGGGERCELDGGWRPGRTSRTLAKADQSGMSERWRAARAQRQRAAH
jgi:hypothetical protein